ncbi:hypothetical protein GCM10009682_06440 [Luedemannella flava]|uniref:non-specific serine/threonine protein kinase n=1 Tax=Luedemannella flava TaxID=349316 RepID=A0ABN2LGA2_9ACTN
MPGRPTDRAVPGVVVGGRYTLRTPLGHGGMGTVWRATDGVLRREVAVKEVLLPPQMPPDERAALCERTMREARACAALSHPSIVQVYDVVTDGGRPWIVMELLESRSLADMIIEDGPLAGRAVAKIGIAMLGALEVAHAVGVLHRDVKPANVLICTDGRCVLTDFGVARLPQESNLTTPGMVLGSPHFISPERAVGGRFGPPSDLFSLGVTLYTAVEGSPPFDKTDPFETMRAVVEEAPRPMRLAGPLAPVLTGLLEKDPARRWTVDQARDMLRELLGGPLGRSPVQHPDTDPYAVVRPPVTPPPAVNPPPPSGQVGGRAMLAPGASLTDHLASLQQPEAPEVAPPPPARPSTYGAPAGHTPSHRHARSNGMGGGLVADLGDRARALRPGSPGFARTVIVGGLALLLVIVGIGALAGWFGGDGDKSQKAGPTGGDPSAPPAAQPLYPEVQLYRDADKGLAVNVPKSWKKSTGGGTWVDFIAPDEAGGPRKVRINQENASGSAAAFLRAAERRLPQSSASCKAAYQRVSLTDAGDLGGVASAELEYTCGEGEEMRHGIWRAIVQGGQATSFYLSVPDGAFEESKIFYSEMVRSFTLTS